MFLRRQVLLLSAAAIALAGSANPAKAESPFSKLYVFGDSLSDTSNVFLATGGEGAGFPYYEGRFSNGPVRVEVLAQALDLPAPEASLLGGSNYAWGAAETGPGLSFWGTFNVGMQIESFLADHGGFAGDELIVVEAGSNDLLWSSPYGAGHIVENLRKHIADLASAGGRTFLIANSPVGGSDGAKLNQLLAQELPKLEQKLGVSIIPFDLAGVYQVIRQNPGIFGLTNITDPACPGCGIGIPEPDAIDTLVPNPDEYFKWDQIHPTRVVHAIMGQAAAEVVWAEVLP
ncbi:MAG TPA: SGNH/GDSL hydrolase family protein [Pirellulaceae bacterium]|nr:SGNH/GDSL hydrolase family protein [Pirellulaceae bacterium]